MSQHSLLSFPSPSHPLQSRMDCMPHCTRPKKVTGDGRDFCKRTEITQQLCYRASFNQYVQNPLISTLSTQGKHFFCARGGHVCMYTVFCFISITTWSQCLKSCARELKHRKLFKKHGTTYLYTNLHFYYQTTKWWLNVFYLGINLFLDFFFSINGSTVNEKTFF